MVFGWGVRIEGAGARPNLDAPPGASFPTASWQLKTDEAKYRFVLLLFGKNRLISLYPPDTPAHSAGSIGPVFPVHPVLKPLFFRGCQYQVTTPLPSPFPVVRAAGSSTRGRVSEGVKNGISYTIKFSIYEMRRGLSECFDICDSGQTRPEFRGFFDYL